MNRLALNPVKHLRGGLRPPSDKSLTHRAFMIASVASEPCLVKTPLLGEDCLDTLRCLQQLGLRGDAEADEMKLYPSAHWIQPEQDLYCGNSGTTMRLLAGLIASRPMHARMTGDASLSRRPMRRIAEPLRLMGADVQGETPPLIIRGRQLKGIRYKTPVPSAQIKSCVLLAGLRADGETWVTEESLSRDHTERMLYAAGVEVARNGLSVGIRGGSVPHGFEFRVPGDISSAAFFAVGAAMLPGSEVVLREVGVNPTRTGVIDVLRSVGAVVAMQNERAELGEPVCDLAISHGELHSFTIEGDLVPRLIDEIPVLAVLATQCDGESTIRDARELRVKESDRIETVASSLRRMGAEVESLDDGMIIRGPTRLQGATVDAAGDHRIGMAFAIAGLIADGTTQIVNADAIGTSYPGFVSDLEALACE
jgi:3-phosphoshikimate 1-carboxyvinyltransferase